jgi:NAD dependent epimerase/dehydratase family enzyme
LGQMADEALLSSARAFPSRLTNARFRFTHPTVAQALTAATNGSSS